MSFFDIDEIVQGMATAHLWTDAIDYTDYDPEVGESGGLDGSHDLSDDGKESLKVLAERFMAEASMADLDAYYYNRTYDPSDGSISAHLGHDIYLTATGSGVSFRDRYEIDKYVTLRLCEAARLTCGALEHCHGWADEGSDIVQLDISL